MKSTRPPKPLAALSALLLLPFFHAAAGESARLLEWRDKAAQGDASAMTSIGFAYFQGSEGVGQDRAEGVDWFKKGAAAGDRNAMNNLGIIYRDGAGIEADRAESHAWFLKAAEAGLVPAQYSVGQNYLYGNGVGKDFTEAEKWLLKADGYPPAVRMLGLLEYARFRETGEGRPERAAELMREAAEMGDVTAKYNLGVFHENGMGVAQDDRMAAHWFAEAAQSGESAAQLALGRCYLAGKGVERNYGEARRWLEAALENGEERARAELAKIPESAGTVGFDGKAWGGRSGGLGEFRMEIEEESGGFTGVIAVAGDFAGLRVEKGVMDEANGTFSGNGAMAVPEGPVVPFSLSGRIIGRVWEGIVTVHAPDVETIEIHFVAERPARVQTIVVNRQL